MTSSESQIFFLSSDSLLYYWQTTFVYDCKNEILAWNNFSTTEIIESKNKTLTYYCSTLVVNASKFSSSSPVRSTIGNWNEIMKETRKPRDEKRARASWALSHQQKLNSLTRAHLAQTHTLSHFDRSPVPARRQFIYIGRAQLLNANVFWKQRVSKVGAKKGESAALQFQFQWFFCCSGCERTCVCAFFNVPHKISVFIDGDPLHDHM